MELMVYIPCISHSWRMSNLPLTTDQGQTLMVAHEQLALNLLPKATIRIMVCHTIKNTMCHTIKTYQNTMCHTIKTYQEPTLLVVVLLRLTHSTLTM